MPPFPEIDGEKIITGFCFVTQFPAVTASKFKSNDSGFSLQQSHLCIPVAVEYLFFALHSHLRIHDRGQE